MPEDHQTPDAVLQALVFLAATSLLVPAFRRIGLSSVMAFLIIGVLIGPHVLGQAPDSLAWAKSLAFDPDGPAHWLAELGVVFLLFAIGLEVSGERLWALRKLVLGFGGAQVVVTGVAITGIAMAFGNAFAVSAVIGMAFALSSTAVVLQVLGERRQLSGPVGRAAFSVVLMQDLAVIPILFIVGALGSGPAFGGGDTQSVLTALGSAIFALAAILLAGRFLFQPLFRYVASVERREVFVAAVLFVVVGAAFAMHTAGLSMALGAFLAGLLLAGTEFRHQIEADIEPFKGLLLGLFFVSVGMQIDLALLASQPVAILIGVAGLFVVKAAIIIPMARLFGLNWPRAVETGFLLAQAGEFAFVILSIAAGDIVPADVADYMLLVIATSIFLTPLTAMAGARVARWMKGQVETTVVDDPVDASGHVIIAGYGRVGQLLGELLKDQEIGYVAVDSNEQVTTAFRRKGWPVHFGDATRKEVLAAMGAERAAAIVVTMNAQEAVEGVVKAVCAAWPDVPVFARALNAEQARRLHDAGAAYAHPETVEASLQLGLAVLGRLGVPDEAATRIIAERRETELALAQSGRAP